MRGLLDSDDEQLPPLFANPQSQQIALLEMPGSPQMRPQFRLWPDDPLLDLLQQYNDEQLYRNVPREQIPPNMRPPIDAPVPRRGNLISTR